MNAHAALSDTGNERIAMGGNMRPFDAHKVNIDDLFVEAQNWLNGEAVASDDEAGTVEQLLDMARQAKKAADEARKVENEPFDAGKAEVQARYNPILKRADAVADACKLVLKPWREAEKRAAAEAARADAERIRQEADAAMRASAGNVLERERAEEKLVLAKEAEKFAKRIGKVAATGNGLRAVPKAILVDGGKAAEHYWRTRNPEFQTFLCELAASDARNGARTIPGFDVIEEKQAV